ncbi:MAG: hypothetical protein RLY71_3298 [Pseudomonadota bacterium]|jgi:antitoxin (DNA-binding transcriptional repressor) of toxin-antitoxin stability system
MRNIFIDEVIANFPALIAEVGASNEIAITRQGRAVARLVPDRRRVAADAFRDFWQEAAEINMQLPADMVPEAITDLGE